MSTTPSASSSALVIAIDGPSGSGKSSVSRGVATAEGMRYLDTGAMYRAVTLWMLRNGVDIDDPAAVAARVGDVALDSVTDPSRPDIALDGKSVSEAIREARVTDAVSRVSAVPQVREALVDRQRAIAREAVANGFGVVVEGRDIASTVLPDAQVKVFLTADQEARAQRRALQDNQEGRVNDVAQAASSLAARDAADSSRAASPLTKSGDATTIDATFLNLDEVIAAVIGLVSDYRAGT